MARSPLNRESPLLVSFLAHGLRGEVERLEAAALAEIRRCRQADPERSAALADALARFRAGAPAAGTPPPADPETSALLLRVEDPGAAPAPVLPPGPQAALDRFVRERRAAGQLLAVGLEPPRALLLHGAPGTGKTMAARRLAADLGLPLATLDLATAVSSLLGRTGLNLRRVFDYARRVPCLLFLDEFDAVAKRRDDAADVGELKRAVNILLKEMEAWPAASVLAAATNHPALLDPAVFRRFDLVVELPRPGLAERAALLEGAWGFEKAVIAAVAGLLEGESAAAITAYAARVVRRRIVDGEKGREVALLEAAPFFQGAPARRARFVRAARGLLGPQADPAGILARAAGERTGLGLPSDHGPR